MLPLKAPKAALESSGKSLLMAFLDGVLMHGAALGDPRCWTDRNDLDDQFFRPRLAAA